MTFWWHLTELILAVPLSAIILGVGGNIIGNILQSRERQLKLRLRAEARQARSAPPASLHKELEALRAEIASLRDTTTQYDMTNDHIVQRIEERLGRVETRLAGRQADLRAEDQSVQQLNRR
jgi:TolA-binding protein